MSAGKREREESVSFCCICIMSEGKERNARNEEVNIF